jgi:hypothetical protein
MQAGFVEDFLSFTVADLDWRFGERFSVVSVIGPTDCDRKFFGPVFGAF